MRIDLHSSAERESIQSEHCGDIGEHRLDGSHPATVIMTTSIIFWIEVWARSMMVMLLAGVFLPRMHRERNAQLVQCLTCPLYPLPL